jgi:hypothetical protein
MEWIIVDDGTDKIGGLIDAAGISQVKYVPVDKKMTLGSKRNLMHSYAKGSIIVYMDDDDYYPPERVEHAVDKLTENREAMCAGSSEIYIYYKEAGVHSGKMFQSGPYGPNHATAGTFAFRAELLKSHKYEDEASLAEERAFLKDYTVPFVQLDPLKTILVFSHVHNTFDKKRLLENIHPQYFRESDKKVADFIRQGKPGEKEESILRFFLEDIDGKLAAYPKGAPDSKPDVLRQIKKLDKERKAKMAEEETKAANMPIGIVLDKQDGRGPIQLTQKDVAELLKTQQSTIQSMDAKIRELEGIVARLQGRPVEDKSSIGSYTTTSGSNPGLKSASKSDPEVGSYNSTSSASASAYSKSEPTVFRMPSKSDPEVGSYNSTSSASAKSETPVFRMPSKSDPEVGSYNSTPASASSASVYSKSAKTEPPVFRMPSKSDPEIFVS